MGCTKRNNAAEYNHGSSTGTPSEDAALSLASPIKGPSMPQSRYFVVRAEDDQWMIKFEDEQFGPYRSQSEAMMFAIDAARKLGERGAPTEVCLMGLNGHFSPEWSYGRDVSQARS